MHLQPRWSCPTRWDSSIVSHRSCTHCSCTKRCLLRSYTRQGWGTACFERWTLQVKYEDLRFPSMVRPSSTKVCTFVIGRKIWKSYDSMVLLRTWKSVKSAAMGAPEIELRKTKADTLPTVCVKMRVRASMYTQGSHSTAVEERNPENVLFCMTRIAAPTKRT